MNTANSFVFLSVFIRVHFVAIFLHAFSLSPFRVWAAHPLPAARAEFHACGCIIKPVKR